MYQLTMRFTGLIASLLLTIGAYFVIVYPEYFNVELQTTIILIVTFAFIQAIVQLIFFINVWKEEGTLWNLGIFISTASIIFIIIFFSIWIMNNLNYNMM